MWVTRTLVGRKRVHWPRPTTIAASAAYAPHCFAPDPPTNTQPTHKHTTHTLPHLTSCCSRKLVASCSGTPSFKHRRFPTCCHTKSIHPHHNLMSPPPAHQQSLLTSLPAAAASWSLPVAAHSASSTAAFPQTCLRIARGAHTAAATPTWPACL